MRVCPILNQHKQVCLTGRDTHPGDQVESTTPLSRHRPLQTLAFRSMGSAAEWAMGTRRCQELGMLPLEFVGSPAGAPEKTVVCP